MRGISWSPQLNAVKLSFIEAHFSAHPFKARSLKLRRDLLEGEKNAAKDALCSNCIFEDNEKIFEKTRTLAQIFDIFA